MEKKKVNFRLLINVVFFKILGIIYNIFLFVLYSILCFSIISILLKISKFNIVELSKNNIFIGFFSALIGGLVSLFGIKLQTSVAKKQTSLKYEYENIIIPIDKVYNQMENLIKNFKYEEINNVFHNCIKEFDFKYILKSRIKKWIELLIRKCEDQDKKYVGVKFLISKKIEYFLKRDDNLSLSTNTINIYYILKSIINGESFSIFNSMGKEINSNYNPNKELFDAIGKEQKVIEFIKTHKQIKKMITSLKTYLEYYISFTKDKIY